MRAAARLLVAAVAAAWAAQLCAQVKSDWEREHEERSWSEGVVTLPAYPKASDLLEFEVGAVSDFRYFIDRGSLSVGKDGVVRYTLVARSPSGVENVSYEGLRCKSATARAYAFGTAGESWSPRGTEWRRIEPQGGQRWQFVLWREYFCPHAFPIEDPAEGIEALRRGGHPRAARAGTFGR